MTRSRFQMIHSLQDHGLHGRVAIVTGAGRGIGRGAAVGLARRAARVVAVDITHDELETTADLVRAEGAEVLPVRADLRRCDEMDRMLRDLAGTWGQPDVLINNAAVLFQKCFEDTDVAVWEETMRVNVEAAYYLTWRIYPHMVARGRGHIITMSSNAGVRPFALETAYCASKYALEGLFRSLALEAASRGLIITLCTPGKMTKPTSMTDAAFATLPEDQRSSYADPEVFAEAFGYLAGVSDPELAGRRFDIFALAELVRQQGWTVPPRLALQRAERDNA